VDEPTDLRLLCQAWLRSRNEDTDTEEVYRPAGYAFPRRERGRAGYRFNPDGTVQRVGIGATDVSDVASGTWRMDGERPDQVRIDIGGQADVLEIADLAPDRLTIRRA
jgi:hypothetical protein